MSRSVTSRIDLDAASFERDERVLVSHGGLEVRTFLYGSGVKALKIGNRDGEAVVLPYHGQQIWDARYYGRRLTMGSMFDAPRDEWDFRSNYGGFLVHCGANSMGTPGPDDLHLPHGELPNAPLEAAWLELGEDGGGAYVVVAGRHEELVAFTLGYRFEPRLRFGATGGRIGLEVSVTNLRQQPMELMYLAHVNFRPVDGARLVDATPDRPEQFRVRTDFDGSDAGRALLRSFAAAPAKHREIVAGRQFDPQLLAAMDAVAGTDGWAHAMQVLPDGAADFISFRPAELDHALRWMVRNGDEDALGLVLPATAEADGRLAEIAKGNMKRLVQGESFRCALAFGALTAAEAAELDARIAEARKTAWQHFAASAAN
jgi:hypothetical protein